MKLSDSIDILRFWAGRFGDSKARRRIARAISIASQPVEATINDSIAADVAESQEGQDK